ncbi:MAG: PIN domain-containing protein [Bryobacteraceae bacterium]
MNGETPVFVDTNILIYALTAGKDSRHRQARARFQTILEQDRLCLSTQVLQEVYVTLTKKMRVSAAEAMAVIEDLAEYPLFQVDRGAILEAGRLSSDSRISYWDALLVVAAGRMGAEVLLTEDLNHGQMLGHVRIENPFSSTSPALGPPS